MDASKRKRLESAGWRVGTAEEFVGECRIVIPGKVETNHRPRVSRGHAFMDRKYAAYKERVTVYALQQRPIGWQRSGRFVVEVVVHEPDKRGRDLDNACKGCLDGARGVLWDDDRQIDRLVIERGEVSREHPRVEVTVRRMEAA